MVAVRAAGPAALGGLGHRDRAVAIQVGSLERGRRRFGVLDGRFLAVVIDAIPIDVLERGRRVGDERRAHRGAAEREHEHQGAASGQPAGTQSIHH